MTKPKKTVKAPTRGKSHAPLPMRTPSATLPLTTLHALAESLERAIAALKTPSVAVSTKLRDGREIRHVNGSDVDLAVALVTRGLATVHAAIPSAPTV